LPVAIAFREVKDREVNVGGEGLRLRPRGRSVLARGGVLGRVSVHSSFEMENGVLIASF